MNSLDLTADRCLERLVAAQKAGEDIRPHVVAVYVSFARHAAESWFANCWGNPALRANSAQLAQSALQDQLDVVPKLNLEYFGRGDRAFDLKCCGAVRKAFNARLREVKAGWS